MEKTLEIAVIGCGERGKATLRRWLQLPALRIAALCDTDPQALADAAALCPEAPETFTDWLECIAIYRYHLVLVCTDWQSHADIAIQAMELGQNVAVEIPAATALDKCFEVKRTADTTGVYFTMLENCCFDPFHLASLQMVRDGVLGEIRHCEGGYIHDLREQFADGWHKEEADIILGNPYPTHGIGPICQLLDIGGSDRLVSLVSTSVAGAPINSTLIRTERGRTILLQYDRVTPRPYSRLQTICASAGYVSKYPVATLQLDGQPALTGAEAEARIMAHRHPWLEEYEPQGRAAGVANMMNYIMDRRLFTTLRQYLDTGIPAPDITPADAALWSIIAPLSHMSVTLGSKPLPIPDTHFLSDLRF